MSPMTAVGLIVADVGVRYGACDGGLLNQAVEQHPARTRGTAVEAEGEFVEVVVYMAGMDSAVMRAKQPAFEQ